MRPPRRNRRKHKRRRGNRGRGNVNVHVTVHGGATAPTAPHRGLMNQHPLDNPLISSNPINPGEAHKRVMESEARRAAQREEDEQIRREEFEEMKRAARARAAKRQPPSSAASSVRTGRMFEGGEGAHGLRAPPPPPGSGLGVQTTGPLGPGPQETVMSAQPTGGQDITTVAASPAHSELPQDIPLASPPQLPPVRTSKRGGPPAVTGQRREDSAVTASARRALSNTMVLAQDSPKEVPTPNASGSTVRGGRGARI